MKQLRPTDLKRLHREWNRRSTGRLALLLDGVQSPFNVGSIVRTAATGCCPTDVSPESITASVPSSTALATSEASARVGREL